MNFCISKGNTKLGKILNISMPSYYSCPGRSKWCEKECYVLKYQKRYKVCERSYENNFQYSKDQTNFSDMIINKISKTCESIVRIHTSGDFYSEDYIDSWIKICSSLSSIKFWTYTRSCVIPNLFEKIKVLNKLNNIQIFLSTDITMPDPPDGFRIAYINNDKRANGFECLYEKNKKTCLECGYCYKTKKGNVIFGKHDKRTN